MTSGGSVHHLIGDGVILVLLSSPPPTRSMSISVDGWRGMQSGTRMMNEIKEKS